MIALDYNSHVTEIWLREALETYRLIDDVFCDDFLSGVIFTRVAGSTSPEISPAANKLLESLGMSWSDILHSNDEDDVPPPGPYVVVGQQLLEIFRLYDDFQGAFMNSLESEPHS